MSTYIFLLLQLVSSFPWGIQKNQQEKNCFTELFKAFKTRAKIQECLLCLFLTFCSKVKYFIDPRKGEIRKEREEENGSFGKRKKKDKIV